MKTYLLFILGTFLCISCNSTSLSDFDDITIESANIVRGDSSILLQIDTSKVDTMKVKKCKNEKKCCSSKNKKDSK